MSETPQVYPQTQMQPSQLQVPGQTQPQQVAPQQQVQQTQQQPIAQQQLGEEQKEFMNIINDMIFAIQELSFALAEVDANEIAKVDGGKELLESARNVVRAGSRFHKFIKKRLRRIR